MTKLAAYLLGLAVSLVGTSGLAGQIGELAPPLVVKEWLKGRPVEMKVGTNIYLIEVWASWSPACRGIITNLNEIQKRFKDKGVIVAGISDEPEEKLKDFLQHAGTNIEYSVASDDAETAKRYMSSVSQRGLPYLFIVATNTTLLWHGPPSSELLRSLDQITAGQYDLAAARKAEIARHQMEQYLMLAQRRDRRTAQAGRSLLAARTNDVVLLCDLAFQIATHSRLPRRDVALANEALGQAEKIASTNAFRVALTRAVLLFETGKQEEALARAKAVLASAKNPKEQQEAQSCLHTMQARLARRAAAKRESSGGSNGIPALVSTNQPASVTNAGSRSPGQEH
jgi:thiol-disulfide isomerase/thioredoxin